MSLSSIGNPAWETIRGIRFAMRHGSLLVPILITHAAVEAIEPPTPAVGGHLACFNKHRSTFEEAARAKYHRQRFTEDGMLTVDARDLKVSPGLTHCVRRRSKSVVDG
jgi:Protein of unknown function (DUF1488)